VHAFALDLHERVFLLSGLPFRRGGEVAAKGKLVDRPACEPKPWTLVVGFGGDADEIVGRALHPARGRKDRREIRIARLGIRQCVLEHREAVAVLDHHAHAIAAAPIALVASP
jgi:hypothetical protein